MLPLCERTSTYVNGATAARFLQQHRKLQQHFTAKVHTKTIGKSMKTMVTIRIGSRKQPQQQTLVRWQQDCRYASILSKCGVPRSN